MALLLVIICGLLSIVYGVWASRSIMEADAGNARMQEIAGAIDEFLMHAVAGERVVRRRPGPVDQHQVPARCQPGDDPFAGEREVAL